MGYPTDIRNPLGLELIEIAGGQDIFPELRSVRTARVAFAEPEEVIRRQPDIIIGSWCGKKFRPEKVPPALGGPRSRQSKRMRFTRSSQQRFFSPAPLHSVMDCHGFVPLSVIGTRRRANWFLIRSWNLLLERSAIPDLKIHRRLDE